MLKFILIAVFIAIGLSYFLAFSFWGYPPSTTTTTTPTISNPVPLMKPNPIVQNDRHLQLLPDENIAITIPANESSTISTEIKGVGGIAGVGKGPTVVNITSGK